MAPFDYSYTQVGFHLISVQVWQASLIFQIRECKVPLALRLADGGNSSFGSVCPDGEAVSSESCNDNACPSWTAWTDWTACTTSCGGGTQRRIRDCVVVNQDDPTNGTEYHVGQCQGDTSEVRMGACPGIPIFYSLNLR